MEHGRFVADFDDLSRQVRELTALTAEQQAMIAQQQATIAAQHEALARASEQLTLLKKARSHHGENVTFPKNGRRGQLKSRIMLLKGVAQMAKRTFSVEFKESAVKLVKERGYTVVEAAKSLGVDASSLRGWLKKFPATRFPRQA